MLCCHNYNRYIVLLELAHEILILLIIFQIEKLTVDGVPLPVESFHILGVHIAEFLVALLDPVTQTLQDFVQEPER